MQFESQQRFYVVHRAVSLLWWTTHNSFFICIDVFVRSKIVGFKALAISLNNTCTSRVSFCKLFEVLDSRNEFLSFDQASCNGFFCGLKEISFCIYIAGFLVYEARCFTSSPRCLFWPDKASASKCASSVLWAMYRLFPVAFLLIWTSW